MTRAGIVQLALVAILAGCSTGLPQGGGPSQTPPPDGSGTAPVRPDAGVAAALLRDASGAPAGVRVTWVKSTASSIDGYWIYRNTAPFPAGDADGYSAYRVTASMIDHDGGAGTAQSHDDSFSPTIGTTYYYAMTSVNTTADEGGFSANASIEIHKHEITGLAPLSGGLGDAVVVNGSYFGGQEGADKVYFSASDGEVDVEATITDWTDTAITVEVPYGAADGDVGVEIGGDAVLTPEGQEFDYDEPTLTERSPLEDWVQHNDVTLTGTDFGATRGSASHVYVGATPAADGDYTSWSDTQIEVKVPAAATGTVVDVKVDVAGNESNTLEFTLLPHVDQLSASEGNTGTSITLSGTNLGVSQGSGGVTVNGAVASTASWGNASVRITIPPEALDGDVVLTRADGKVAEALGFDVIPTFSGFTPARRVAGEQLTLTGSGFGGARNGSTVTFADGGLEAAAYLSWNVGQIVVEVPAGAATGAVTVTVDDTDIGDDKDNATSVDSVIIILAAPDIEDIDQL